MRQVALYAFISVAPFCFSQEQPKTEPPKVFFFKDARIVVKPGEVIDQGSVLIKDGKIAAIGRDLTAPAGAEVIDCKGLTAYPGLIHPFYRVSVDGVVPAQAGGRGGNQATADANAAMAKRDADPFGLEGNFLTKVKTSELKQKDVSTFQTLAKSGYGLLNASASGGLLGPTSTVYSLAGKDIDPSAVVGSPMFVPIGLSSRGFGSYPSSTMGVIALIRQCLYDANRYGRLNGAGKKQEANPGFDNLFGVTTGQVRPVFDDLSEVTFFEANKIVREFGLKPIYGFREDAGAVSDLLKSKDVTVLLKGTVPSKPSIGTDLNSVSLGSVRGYFAEVQAGSELEKAGVSFCYAPSSSSEPLDGIRTYVRGGLSEDKALAAMTTGPAELLGMTDSAGTLEVGKMGNLMLVEGDLFDTGSQVMAVVVAGKRVDFKMPDRKPEIKKDTPIKVMAPKHELFPAPAETTQAYRLYKNATVWTMGPQGVLRNADVLIKEGKIIQVGRNLKAPSGCESIDATGKHISPGIWDCHSHTGINGSVNESSNMVTIECRIADVINHQAINIYQQLSGGTVGAQQLHGSANAIGGQTSPVKWRWGMRPTDFPIAGAPQGVKFALGQNPIREDTGQTQAIGSTLLTWRPRTRMGVEESIRRALQLGKEYNQEWADFKAGKIDTEPRRNLQYEALGEIVGGTRYVHSHGYRADELLMLLRVVNEFGGKIATLQHVLEGYKIADEMADQGVGGSTFSDWWGYKLEAYDAIPYNAAIMASRGVSVSINSDSDNHARRLNQEAAKCIRYGGVSPEKALSFVTIEPARQMGIADHTGSLEAGKDADLVVWSADPTSIFAQCLETYVDGVKRFDRANDRLQRAQREAELLEAKKVLTDTTAGTNPFVTDAGGLNANNEGANKAVGRTSAKFGIGPVKGEPGTTRYNRQAVLITRVTVHPMEGNPFVGDVLIDSNGKIEAVGNRLSSMNAVTVDGMGKHLYPGLIDPATGIGLNEIGQVPASDDSSERGAFHPDYKVERTINPEWETMGVARQQGVLTVIVKPTGSGLPGQAALINTEGYTWEDLTIQSGVAMTYGSGAGGGNFSDDSKNSQDEEEDDGDGHSHDTSGATEQNRQNEGGGNQSAPYAGLSKQLDDARTYFANRSKATPDKPVVRDQKQDAMALVAQGEMPVMFNVNSASDIKAVVAWAEKENIRVILYGCTGAGEIADWLAEKQVPIILSAVYNMPSGDQPVDFYYSLPARLQKAGVKFCLSTNNDKDVRQIRDQAGWAAAYGIDHEEAARLITLRAAEVLGIQDRLGAIKPGLDGTLILTDGEIVETKTKVLKAWIQGREIDLTNKQTRLYDKYKSRPKLARKKA